MNYPNKISKTKVKNTNYANRGMFLEEDLNLSNKYYLESNIAIIHKKPTPIKIVKVSFDSKKNATINEAYFKMPSTTDYNGIYKGKYIDFEAKEVKNNKCFPLSNINNHQIMHIKNVINHGGIAFLIVRFNIINTTFVLKGEDLLVFVDENKKSIPLAFFKEKGFIIKESFVPRLNYLESINNIYLGEKQ